MAEIVSATVSGNIVTITYDEAMTTSSGTPASLFTSSNAAISVTNISGLGTSTWTLTLGQSISSTDYIAMANYGYTIHSVASSSTYLEQGTAFVGSSGITTLDFSDANINTPSPYAFFPGEGADVVSMPTWSSDYTNLSEITKVTDTVSGGDQWVNDPVHNADLVVHFDVSSGASTNDKLNLHSGMIVANTGGYIAGTTPAGTVVSHSITGGIISFKDGSNNLITIDTDAEKQYVYDYLNTNLSAGETVAFATSDNGTNILAIFQKCATNNPSYVIGLTLEGITDFTGITLGNSAGVNVIQIEDTTGPLADGAVTTVSGLDVYFTENIVSIDTTGIKIYKNGTTDMNVTTSVADATLHLTSSTETLTDTDFVVLDVSGMVNATAMDIVGNTANYFGDVDFQAIAIGGSGNNTIDLSLLTNVFEADGALGDDTLIGTSSNDDLMGAGGMIP